MLENCFCRILFTLSIKSEVKGWLLNNLSSKFSLLFFVGVIGLSLTIIPFILGLDASSFTGLSLGGVLLSISFFLSFGLRLRLGLAVLGVSDWPGLTSLSFSNFGPVSSTLNFLVIGVSSKVTLR